MYYSGMLIPLKRLKRHFELHFFTRFYLFRTFIASVHNITIIL